MKKLDILWDFIKFFWWGVSSFIRDLFFFVVLIAWIYFVIFLIAKYGNQKKKTQIDAIDSVSSQKIRLYENYIKTKIRNGKL